MTGKNFPHYLKKKHKQGAAETKAEQKRVISYTLDINYTDQIQEL